MRILRLVAVVASLVATAPAGAQQSPPSAETRAAYDAAFQETLRKPGDPGVLLRYADLAVQVGDLEAAISALERLLLIDGDQPKVKLELGVLYFRLGSYEAARTYLESARQSARATAETRERADDYLREVDSKVSRSQFSGDVMVGLGYSTNANSGPGAAAGAFGATAVTNPNISQRPDFNVIGAATLRHRYDLNRQDNGALESELQFYASRQFQVAEANVIYLDFTTGPRTSPFETGFFDELTWRPFLTGRYVNVQDATSYWAWGGGLEFGAPLGPQIASTLSVFGRRREFVNTVNAPTNNQSSGDEGVVSLEFRVELTSSMTMTLNGAFTRFLAMTPGQSYGEVVLGGAMEVRFADPLSINGRNWSVTASLGTAAAVYDQPDPLVSSTTARSQNDVNLGLILAIPLDDRISLIGQANYFQRSASLSTYAYDAFSTMMGIGWRF